MDRLFVYGIFLGEYMRQDFEMTNPKYDTVEDYATFGHHIVMAQHIPDVGFALTGLLVDIPDYQWERLDKLEGGYQRKLIKTTNGHEAYMYVGR